MKGQPDGLKLSPDKVTIRRGGRELAKVVRLPKPEPAPVVKLYLSDLNEFGWAGFAFHNNWEGTANGVKYTKAVFMHPPRDGSSRIKYRLNNLDAYAFEAKVAILDSVPAGSATPLTFQVVGDGKVLWSSKLIQAKGDTQDCRVPVEGIDVLELRVVCPGPHSYAHAVWLDPYVLSNKRKP